MTQNPEKKNNDTKKKKKMPRATASTSPHANKFLSIATANRYTRKYFSRAAQDLKDSAKIERNSPASPAGRCGFSLDNGRFSTPVPSTLDLPTSATESLGSGDQPCPPSGPVPTTRLEAGCPVVSCFPPRRLRRRLQFGGRSCR